MIKEIPCTCGMGNVEMLGHASTCERAFSQPQPPVRTFNSGATRDTDEGKLDFEGFFSPGVMFRFAQYMNENRVQSDGNLRDSDNWQKGIPREQYMKSMYRHFMEVWAKHRALQGAVPIAMADEMETALCAMMFNVMGYMFEMQQGR